MEEKLQVATTSASWPSGHLFWWPRLVVQKLVGENLEYAVKKWLIWTQQLDVE